MLNVFMLSVVRLSVVMLNVDTLSVVTLSVVMLNASMLSIVEPYYFAKISYIPSSLFVGLPSNPAKKC